MNNFMSTDEMDKFLEKYRLSEFTAAPSPEHCSWQNRTCLPEGNLQTVTN